MIGLDEAQTQLIEELRAAGIPAYSHAREIHDLPAALISPASIKFRTISGQILTVEYEIYLLAQDNGHDLDALADLSELVSKIMYHHGCTEFETVAVTIANLGGKDSLPALKTNITVNFKEKSS